MLTLSVLSYAKTCRKHYGCVFLVRLRRPMIRFEISYEVAPILPDQLVVCNIGLSSEELHLNDNQPTLTYWVQ